MRAGSVPHLLLAGAAILTACETQEFQPPSDEERVALADSLYSPTLFDTLTWASDSLRLAQGNLVFADECRSCHGPLGRGGTDYAESRGLEVPSLVEPGWEYADDMEAVRRRIFVGHVSGMPSWGIGRLSPRQIDAATYYLLEQLRPELLGEGEPPAGG